MNKSQSVLYRFILEDKFWLVRHLLFWSVYFSDELLSFAGITPEYEDWECVLLRFVVEVSMVYLNLYVLIPKFFAKNKIYTYLFLTALSILVFAGIEYYFLELDIMGNVLSDLIYLAISKTMIIGLAISIKLFKINYRTRANLDQVSLEKLKTELGFLKNQVNPHFLFNTMNSFYIQAKKKDDKLPDAIMALSDLLRYQIYDTEKEFVSIASELEYIRNYLDLEKNRRDALEIKITSDKVTNHDKIAPLLLLPVVENATKYSQRTDGGTAVIEVEMKVIDNYIYFSIKNTKGKIDQIKSPDSGVGLDNLTRRLELIYPDDHEYKIEETEESYKSILKVGVR